MVCTAGLPFRERSSKSFSLTNVLLMEFKEILLPILSARNIMIFRKRSASVIWRCPLRRSRSRISLTTTVEYIPSSRCKHLLSCCKTYFCNSGHSAKSHICFKDFHQVNGFIFSIFYLFANIAGQRGIGFQAVAVKIR